MTDTLAIDSAFDKLDCQYYFFYRGHKKIQAGATYCLRISYGAEVLTATVVTDVLPPQIDSAVYIAKFNDINGEHEGVIIYFKDAPSQTNFYRYELLRYVDTSTLVAEQPIVSACLGADSIQVHELGRAVYTDAGLQGGQIKIVAEPSYSHKAGKSGYVFIQAIDKNAYDFLDQLDRQKIAAGNPFAEPVFIQPGQFGDKAVGYFSAKKNSPPVLFIYPE